MSVVDAAARHLVASIAFPVEALALRDRHQYDLDRRFDYNITYDCKQSLRIVRSVALATTGICSVL